MPQQCFTCFSVLLTSDGATMFHLFQCPVYEWCRSNVSHVSVSCLRVMPQQCFTCFSVLFTSDAAEEWEEVCGGGQPPLPVLQLPAGGDHPLLHQVVQGQHGVLPLHPLRYVSSSNLLEKCWRISLYVTDAAITYKALCDVKFSQMREMVEFFFLHRNKQ